MDKLIEMITAYVPYNEQEEKDREMILYCLKNDPYVLTRRSPAHLSASCWITNRKMDRVLLCFHNIYGSYSWLGGHCDGDPDVLRVALREANEESGISTVPVSDDIFSLEVLTVDGHIKRGEYVPSHLHLNVTFLLMADEGELLKVKKDENSDVKWFNIEEVDEAVSEAWMKERVYRKLNEKLLSWRNEYETAE